MMRELADAVTAADANDRCAASSSPEGRPSPGPDVKEMAGKNFSDVFFDNLWPGNRGDQRVRKPMSRRLGLGGGCELAMMCDFILAADTAKFGQRDQPGIVAGMGARSG